MQYSNAATICKILFVLRRSFELSFRFFTCYSFPTADFARLALQSQYEDQYPEPRVTAVLGASLV